MQTDHSPLLAIGFPDKDPNLDVYSGFVSPPKGYGEVAFYWWMGDKLTKERLQWQLDQLKDHHITALQVNYAHSDEGGDSFGLTYVSDPPLFSKDWWDLFRWFAEKCGEYGIAVSLSDYTLCTPGQGWYTDEIRLQNPEMIGATLQYQEWHGQEGAVELVVPQCSLCVRAYMVGESEENSSMDLTSSLQKNVDEHLLRVQLPEGQWTIIVVYSEENPRSLDPMHPKAGAKVIEHFFQRFEDHLAGVPNARLSFFFSDELEFGIKGFLWNNRFREEFIKKKGYDILPELPALFTDIGSRTPKIRLDYKDVLVTLSEKHYFIPVYEWHQERGMIYGCDHGGRGKDVTEFGDYFRTQRWNQGPGCDQPYLECDLIKNKVASSIAHLYNRPRTWLEGYHSSGWGTNTDQLTDATFRNFATGHNLLSLHGLYYSTHGGWWEWAPPCNHFRMPYWNHMESFLGCTERLSYLLSQGVHACDVAIVYPVASMEAGIDGDTSVETAFTLGEHLYAQGIDFDFIDFESLDRADIVNRELRIAGEVYRVLVLPAMRTLRYSTLQKALQFYQTGGIVIALGSLPVASERAGHSDPTLDAAVFELFGLSAYEVSGLNDMFSQSNNFGGTSITALTCNQVSDAISHAFPRDFHCLSELPDTEFPYFIHRKMGLRDVYMVYRAPKEAECFFRCHGQIELWNPWDGSVIVIHPHEVTSEGTTLLLPLDREAVHLIVFTPQADDSHSGQVTNAALYSPSPSQLLHPTTEIVQLNGPWEFELQPVLDNQFGDFRLPATEERIGAEARQFRYALETSPDAGWQHPQWDDSQWAEVTYGYGPYFMMIGPIPRILCSDSVEQQLASLSMLQEGDSITIGDRAYSWKPYAFSMRYGVEGDPGHQGFHGLKGKISDHFIALGEPSVTLTEITYAREEAGDVYFLWSTFDAGIEQSANLLIKGNAPEHVWLNGQMVDTAATQIEVKLANNQVLLRYDQPGRGYVVFESSHTPKEWHQPYPLAMSWYQKPGLFNYDVLPQRSEKAGWYRFTAPPGLQAIDITAFGSIQIWVGGSEQTVLLAAKHSNGSKTFKVNLSAKIDEAVLVAMRITYEDVHYAGAALPEPIRFTCSTGLISLGDWSKIDGLRSYSGGALYRTTYDWTHSNSPSNYRVLLNLGSVISTAEIRINGLLATTLVAPPWKIDISSWLLKGSNTIEVIVFNTLANHYTTIPTRYRGDLMSGLIGPVNLEFIAKIQN